MSAGVDVAAEWLARRRLAQRGLFPALAAGWLAIPVLTL
jgi:hypothetical protein